MICVCVCVCGGHKGRVHRQQRLQRWSGRPFENLRGKLEEVGGGKPRVQNQSGEDSGLQCRPTASSAPLPPQPVLLSHC